MVSDVAHSKRQADIRRGFLRHVGYHLLDEAATPNPALSGAIPAAKGAESDTQMQATSTAVQVVLGQGFVSVAQ